LIEVIAETDDVLLEKFLEGETPTIENSRPASARPPSI